MTEVRRLAVTLSDGRDIEVIEAGEQHQLASIVHNGTPSGAGLIEKHVAALVLKRV
ncbi:hypothetical protein [Alicyclobacillus mengziensis]|uniref:Uncharacterized protein n=1 Tax=Alicyclobacillus mengziensis TaxID=2931921 RepID=A0A9X7Z4U5_9BACL|nr:hypothetical protein [Alicyclobacillus mengziensis]QSO46294.1 hypothetical protein JZ786_17580 [Alicyclobacillus mengziensis]